MEAAERARIATVVVPAPASLAPVRIAPADRHEDDERDGEEEDREERKPSSDREERKPSSSARNNAARPSTPQPRAVSPRGGSPRRPPLAPPPRARVSVEDSAMSRRTTPRRPPSPSRNIPSTRDDLDEEQSAAATKRAVIAVEIEQARRFGGVLALSLIHI